MATDDATSRAVRWAAYQGRAFRVRDDSDGFHTPESAAAAFRPTQLERERAVREATAAACASAWRDVDPEARVVLRVHAPELSAALDALAGVHRG